MAITKPPVLPAWADAGDKVQPSNAELSVGWPVSSTPPSRQRFNWVLNFVANAVRYFSRRGMPDYDAAETYMTGDRIIGDDGKTYKCLADNTTGFAPSTNPAKWGRWGFTLAELNAESTTPAQFDNSTKLATTAFLQGRGFQFGDFVAVSANRSATVADIGKILWFSGAYTLTLPTPQSLGIPIGSTITVYGTSGTGVVGTVAAGSGASFDNRGGAGATVAIKDDFCTFLASSNTQWAQLGTADLQKTGAFAQSKTSSGYQKLPGGLIIQWVGGKSFTASGSQVSDTTSLPIAFPTARLGTFPTSYQNGTLTSGDLISITDTGTNLTQTTVRAVNSTAGATGYGYIAIGY